jgi:hypothetical protein
MAEIKEELKQQIAGDLLLQLVNFAMIDSARMTDAIKFASQTGDDPYLIVKNDSQFSETR